MIEAGALRLTWSKTGRIARVQCGGADLTGAGVSASGMAKRYRGLNLTRRGLKPLRERAKDNPALDYSSRALEIRLRLGVKPVPCPVAEQTPDTEPEMRVFMTFDNARELFEECRRQGVGETEFCLVGWNISGHDGRYPQVFPVEERLGGEAKLREAISRGQELGYQVVAHDCYYAAYRIAEDWDEEYLRKDHDGAPVKGGEWGGGTAYRCCLERALELFAKRNLPASVTSVSRGSITPTFCPSSGLRNATTRAIRRPAGRTLKRG